MTCFVHIFQGQQKNIQNYRILTSFLTLSYTLWECQVNKTHNFEWNDPIVPDWASRCVGKTNTQHCKSSLWYPVTLVTVSTPLFKQQGRKRGEENCRSEVRGHVISRDPAGKIRKTGWFFFRNASHIILGLFTKGCGLSHPQTSKNAWSVIKEKSSCRDLPTALICSRDGWKKIREKYLRIRFLVWMSGCFYLPASVTDFAVMRYIDK